MAHLHQEFAGAPLPPGFGALSTAASSTRFFLPWVPETLIFHARLISASKHPAAREKRKLQYPVFRFSRQRVVRLLQYGGSGEEETGDDGQIFSPFSPPSPSEIPQISDCEGLKTSQYSQHRENLNGILNNSGMYSLPSLSSFVVEKLFVSVTRHLERQCFGHQFPTCRRRGH